MSQPAARPPAGDSYGWPSPDRAADRWSFGGGAPLPIAAGVLSPRVLVIGPGHAALDASLMPAAETQHQLAGPGRARVPGLRLISALLGRRPADEQALRFDDVIVTDDREVTHTLSFESGHIPPARPGKVRGPIWLRLRLDPAPGGPAERELSDLARSLIGLQLAGIGHDGEGPDLLAERCSAALDRAARISRSGELDSASELPGQLATLCDVLTGQHPDGSLSPAWSGMLDAALQTDGPSRHLDIAAGLPPVNGTTVRLDSLRARPRRPRRQLPEHVRRQHRTRRPRRTHPPVPAAPPPCRPRPDADLQRRTPAGRR
jgi:hypothetical protein